MMWRTRILLLILACGFLSSTASDALAQCETLPAVFPADVTCAVDLPCEVAVKLDAGGQTIASVAATLSFDAAHACSNTCAAGSAAVNGACAINPSTCRFNVADLTVPIEAFADGDLALLTVTCHETGSQSLELTAVSFGSLMGTPVGGCGGQGTLICGRDLDNDGLSELDDPCPSDPRNRCFGPVALDQVSGKPIRLNASVSLSECSDAKIDCNGEVWQADFGYNLWAEAHACNLNGGGEACVIEGIVELFGCEDETTEDIFQCEHWDDTPEPELAYSFAVPDGAYLVNLFFANTYTGTVALGSRIFDIVIEGEIVYGGFDQVAAAGGSARALVRSALVDVIDGNGLQIEFLHAVENPALKAIEVFAAPSTVSTTLPSTTTTLLPTTTTILLTTTTLPPTTTTVPPVTTTLPLPTTTTLPELAPCAETPEPICLEATQAHLDYNERSAGKEKVNLRWKQVQAATAQADFGDPVAGTTAVGLCVYDDAAALVQGIIVDRAGEQCAGKDCWKAKGTNGFVYKDKNRSAQGVSKIGYKAGAAGKGAVQAGGKNNSSKGQNALPTGVVAGLSGNTSLTIQIVTSDGLCIGATMTEVKKDEAMRYTARKK